MFKSVEDRIHERPMFFNPYAFGSSIVGGWKELGRTTFGGGAKEYSVASLDDKRYYMILVNNLQSAQTEGDAFRLNSDSGSNFSYRHSTDGAADTTGTSKSKAGFFGFHPHTQPSFAVSYLSNLSTKEKLSISHGVGHKTNVSGAGNAPDRGEAIQKWANTSNAVDEVNIVNLWNNYDSGSECVVLGWDPADTHTTNFWEQLADVTGGASSNISSGTITAKKYLWVQFWYDRAATFNVSGQFNNDTASNYSSRFSDNGGADGTQTSASSFIVDAGGASGKPNFHNMFIINNSANEKLLIHNNMQANSAGATNAPTRREGVSKWANTSAQITEIDFNTSASSFVSGARLKVWGSD